jgi:Mg2+/Co2+ transporter CorB
VVLVLISAFFSISETGMMSLNRYRLKHLAHHKNRNALKVQYLLERTDKLLSVILIGNTLSNLFASSLATVIAYQLFGEWGVLIATIILSVVVLVFGEVTPKTIAAMYPQQIAFFAATPLRWLLVIFYPVVWVVSAITKGFLKLFGIVMMGKTIEPISAEELRTLVQEASNRISDVHQDMLLRILDLEKMTVDDVMIPRHQIMGIELDQDWKKIIWQLMHSKHTRLPIFYDEIDNVLGVINLRHVISRLHDPHFDQNGLKSLSEEVYYIPEGTSLTTQLLNFRRERRKIALVVNEYGDIIGLVTVEDILEEIVGELASEIPSVSKLVTHLPEGGYVVGGDANIRELNRLLGLQFPTEGPKTLSGLIVEYLEAIPHEQTCLKLENYPIEILRVEDNLVKQVVLLTPFD